ncbi:MAG: phospholipase D-like domain-containing protein [Halobacteriales archaeon]
MSPRKRSRAAFGFALLALFCVAVAPVAADDARIVEVYPDPYADGDAGEYVAVEFEGTDTSGWTLEDDDAATPLPNRTLDGTVYFAANGGAHDRRDFALGLSLANSGETVVLRDASDDVIDRLSYGDGENIDPTEGELVVRDGDGFEIHPFGATDLEPLRANASSVVAFTLPDSPGVVSDAFREADNRVLVSAYSFGSRHLAGILDETEANVEVLVEGSPPGGFPVSTERALESLDGARRYVADGEKSRYTYFHAKYAVADDTAVVTSENFGDRNFAPNATGSRGWGVAIESEEASDYLAHVFREDTDWRAVSSWENASVDAHEQDESDAEVRTDFEPARENRTRLEVFVAPDTGVEPVVSLIESADDEVLVQQAYVRSWNGALESNPYVDALRNVSSRGVDVRVLLDARWYYEEENAEVADALNASGIDARLAERPTHTKGVVVDNESVLVSSINWNENSPTDNREVGVVVHDEEVASYFADVFESDWTADGESAAADSGSGSGTAPTDYLLEAVIIALVSGIAVWLVTREL